MAEAVEKQPVVKEPKKKHPPGLYLLFATEAWERFSYYGMRSLLVLYLTTALVSGGLGFSQSSALALYGFFTGAVYFTPIIGGYLTDKSMTRRHAITLGGILMAIGNFALFAQQSHVGLYTGLVLIIIGNGFFKPNISTLVGELYSTNDKRRDAAFTIFYMGINLGAFVAPLVVGTLADKTFAGVVDGVMVHGYKYGFLAAGIGMVIGQLVFNLLGNRYLGTIGTTVASKQNVSKTGEKVETAPLTTQEKKRTAVILILASFVVFFWAGFEQAGSSLTLYTNTFVDKTIFGWEMPTAWFASLNPFFIIVLAPIVSLLWVKLANSKRGDLSAPAKMGLGMILLGLGYMVLLVAIFKTGSDETAVTYKANLMFIIFTYFLHTVGELALSPVGLSLVSRIAPVKLASLLMGVWLASTGVANILAGQLAVFTQSLGYFEVFALIGGLAIGLGLVLLAFSKKLEAMME